MKSHIPQLLEKGRYREGRLGTDERFGLTGMFHVLGPCGTILRIVASGNGPDNMGWEHVSVSCEKRCPNWREMCFVKDLFWDEDEVVMQLHPAKKDYINYAPNCLHMWKPIGQEIPTPPHIMVGPRDAQELAEALKRKGLR